MAPPKMAQCLDCEQEFEVSQSGFPPNKIVSSILAKEFHLSDEEKTIKYAIQELVQQLEHFQSDFKLKHSDLERISSDHFSELRRQIDVQREKLKIKIDEIALKMTARVNQKEKINHSKVKQLLLAAIPVDIKQARQTLENEFRKPNILIEEIKRMQNEQQQRVNEFQTRLRKVDTFCGKIKSFVFKPSHSLRDESFGLLKSNELIAIALDKNIQIWNLAYDKCVANLEGHANSISCLDNIDENRFASVSADNTIRIWDAQNFACLKRFTTSRKNKVVCLKSLPSNRLASGSYLVIEIWSIESGECLKTLNGHSDWVRDIVYLPSGNLVSCSWDKTIKMWDLGRGECIQTITSHSDEFCCLHLLRNGQLASSSYNKKIKIWNMESGECVKTLQGHSSYTWRLQQLESGELVSCSNDSTIKIWDITEGCCARTLVEHSGVVRSIRINSLNNNLVSCSDDGTIKTWDSRTGEFFNTVADLNACGQFVDLIFI